MPPVNPLIHDAAESAFFERELESLMAKTYDKKYPELMARQILPVDNAEDPGADTIVYQSFDSYGMAKVIASYSDDLPLADVAGTEHRSPVRAIGSAYRISLKDIESAFKAGRPLETMKAAAARKACETKLDDIAALGDTGHGLVGLLSIANANSYTVANGAGGGANKTWATKTAAEKLADLQGIVRYGAVQTNGVERPNTLGLPIDHYEQAKTEILNTTTGETVLAAFERTSGVKAFGWNKLAGAGANATNRMVAFKRDPDVIKLRIVQEFRQLPAQPSNLAFKVPCWMQTGGVICMYPMSVTYGDGI